MGFETAIIVLLASAFGFYMAWSIGANDVANAMGTSVGSGALTLKRAVIIAAVLEFGGALLVGGHVTETVRRGMLNIEVFGDPHPVMLGMLASLLASAIWLQVATYFGWPVSTSHSIVGAIVGFGLLTVGFGGIYWDKVGSIAASWVISPFFSATIALVLFVLIRRFILEAANPVRAMRVWAPWLIFIVFMVLSLVTALKGLQNLDLNLGLFEAVLISFLISSTAAFIGNEMVGRIKAPREPNKDEEVREQTAFQARIVLPTLQSALRNLETAEEKGPEIVQQNLREAIELVSSAESDLQELGHYRLTAFREKSYIFVEKVFKYLQILSACAVAFAHGANDVANAIGPLAAVLEIANTGVIKAAVSVDPLLLALGGLGIVLGLMTWGWRIIETLGRKITELTPTRGFSAEFGAALTILIASRLGLPVSTTHCLVGAVMGVGLARGLSSLNLRMLWNIVLSWLFTIPIAAGLATVIYLVLALFFPV